MEPIGIGTGNEMMQINKDLARENAISRAKSFARQRNVSEEQIDKVAQEFEAVFLGQMLQHMFSGIDPDPNFGGGQSEEVYKSLLVDEYGKLLSRTGGVGVADQVKREMLKLQEVAQ